MSAIQKNIYTGYYGVVKEKYYNRYKTFFKYDNQVWYFGTFTQKPEAAFVHDLGVILFDMERPLNFPFLRRYYRALIRRFRLLPNVETLRDFCYEKLSSLIAEIELGIN